MKRVRAACILQTLVFSQRPELGFSREHALKNNRDEFERYKANLEYTQTRYQIDSAAEQKDGSLVVHIRKQYNENSDISEYFK